MIGPHEGKELELMLSGQKKFAVFYDLVKANYQTPEEIIPESLFSQHVANGTIVRLEQSFVSRKSGDKTRYVCFALPGQEWRALTYLWIKEETLSGVRSLDRADEAIMGRLLGYSEKDISSFLNGT